MVAPYLVPDKSKNSAAVFVDEYKPISTAVKKFGASALNTRLRGTTLPVQISTAGDFTVECFARWDSTVTDTAGVIYVGTPVSGTNVTVRRMSSGFLALYSSSSSSNVIVGTTQVTFDVFHHIELSKAGSNYYLFLNGALVGSAAASSMGLNIVIVGSDGFNGLTDPMFGYIDEVRVTVGSARHSAAFTAPTSAFPADSTGDPLWNSVEMLYSFDSVLQIGVGAYSSSKAVEGYAAWPADILRKVTGPRPVLDFQNTGRGRIAGTVKKKDTPINTPLRRKVWLMRELDGGVVREVWSNMETGAYVFDYIDETYKYAVIAFDYEHEFRAVIADNLTPEIM